MTQHTPGPWTVTYNDDGEYLLDGPSTEICTLHCRKADARLIAKAPDLLHQLDSLHNIAILISNKHHAGNPIPDDLWADLHDYALAAHSLIAQAEGRTKP